MNHPNFIILYVESSEASTRFYSTLLDAQPVEVEPDFALFRLNSGLMLGLWTRDCVAPVSEAQAGSVEIVFSRANKEEVEETHRQWRELGLKIIQPPLQAPFGYTFTAEDPNGHRLRVYCPGAM